jgi:dihydroorotate dehydrogenase (fumarate)
MDLKTSYMGLELKNPIVPSASPLSENVDSIKRLEDAGAAAVVMFSIFEEQLRTEQAAIDHYTSAGTDSFAEALNYFPAQDEYFVGPDNYLELIRKATQAVSIPVIGSINCISPQGWVDYAKKIEQAGASALELNTYYIPTELNLSGAAVESRYIEVAKAVKAAVKIPVAMKLSPYFSNIANMAKQLDEVGVDGLVLFNRFYQPDFDLDNLEVAPNLSLSTPNEIRLPLLWVAVLHGRVQASLAATSGIHTAREAIKFILAGADVAMVASTLLKNGVRHIGRMLDDIKVWMDQHEYKSVEQMKGALSQKSVADPTAFERANYIKILENYKDWESAAQKFV